MNKQENNKTRIDLIKEERYELLKEVRENIKSGNKKVIENMNEIISVLNYDEKNIKKYEALKEAQELIEKLTIEISLASSKEEIELLRKKLNYYINKIKNEAKKRNIDYNNFSLNVTEIRKNIAKCIRFIKRKSQIEELETLNEKYESLSEDEKKYLQRQLSSARNYNTRIIKESTKKEVLKEETSKEENVMPLNKFNPDFSQNRRKIVRDKFVLDLKNDPSKRQNLIETYSSDREFISAKIDEFDELYKIDPIYDYNNSFCQNLVNFIKNIPIYNSNKKILKKMYHDYMCFHHAADLAVYIDYMQKSNSVKEGLKGVFKKSALYSKEDEHLDNHDKCVNWILSYVESNNIRLKYVKAK